jgi:hypothetical protein
MTAGQQLQHSTSCMIPSRLPSWNSSHPITAHLHLHLTLRMMGSLVTVLSQGMKSHVRLSSTSQANSLCRPDPSSVARAWVTLLCSRRCRFFSCRADGSWNLGACSTARQGMRQAACHDNTHNDDVAKTWTSLGNGCTWCAVHSARSVLNRGSSRWTATSRRQRASRSSSTCGAQCRAQPRAAQPRPAPGLTCYARRPP